MLNEHRGFLNRLSDHGWRVSLQPTSRLLPREIKTRYNWLPQNVEDFVTNLETAVSPSETAWFLGLPDFSCTGSSAYRWNEWEELSLTAATEDRQSSDAIRRFWDQHFPVTMSVKSGYAYFAVRMADMCVVRGDEPEFEETIVVASSFLGFLNLLADLDPNLSIWI